VKKSRGQSPTPDRSRRLLERALGAATTSLRGQSAEAGLATPLPWLGFGCRRIGKSVEMNERTCGHRVRDADDAFRSRLEAYGKLAEADRIEEAR
jgi:hypothetical protein